MDEANEIWKAEKEGRSEPMTQNDWAYLYNVLNEHDKTLTADGQPTTPYRMKLLSKLARRMHEEVNEE